MGKVSLLKEQQTCSYVLNMLNYSARVEYLILQFTNWKAANVDNKMVNSICWYDELTEEYLPLLEWVGA